MNNDIKLKVEITGQGCIKCIGNESNEKCLSISNIAMGQGLQPCVGRPVVYVEDK